jgi:hypothetical protein
MWYQYGHLFPKNTSFYTLQYHEDKAVRWRWTASNFPSKSLDACGKALEVKWLFLKYPLPVSLLCEPMFLGADIMWQWACLAVFQRSYLSWQKKWKHMMTSTASCQFLLTTSSVALFNQEQLGKKSGQHAKLKTLTSCTWPRKHIQMITENMGKVNGSDTLDDTILSLWQGVNSGRSNKTGKYIH